MTSRSNAVRALFLVMLLASFGVGETALLMTDDFEAADTTCWKARPNAGGTENWAGCNDPPLWAPIADPAYSTPRSLIRVYRPSPYYQSSNSAVGVTYPKDEALSYAQYNFSEGHILFTQYIALAPSFDVPFGLKTLRFDIWDSTLDASLSSFIVVIYNQGIGTHVMGGLTLTKNGGENYGYADGITFTAGTMYKMTVEISLNTPCQSDGYAKMWLNDSLITSRTGMGGTDMRPSGCSTLPIHFARLGGWYSNSGVDPTVPSTVYYDNVELWAIRETPRWGPFGENDIFQLKFGF